MPQYLGQLADHVVTTINVRDYGQTIHDLATRRQVILIGEDVVNAALNSPVDFPPKEQIEEAETRLKALRATANGTTLLTPLSGTMPLPISWLWRMRFAQGKISLLAGQPGRGKSQLTVFFASVVTTGGNWPDGEPCQLGSVIFITCEDDPADTIVPRLMAVQADLDRCHMHSLMDLGKDVSGLVDQIRAIGDVRLVVIDPVSAYLGKIDGNNAPEVRRTLAPLQQMAADTNVAVLLVTPPKQEQF